MSNFLKELLRAVVMGSLLFFGFLVYYYFTDSPRFDLIVKELWREYFDSIIFFIVMYMANMFCIKLLLKKYDSKFYTARVISIALFANIIVSGIAVFIGRLMILTVLHGQSFDEFLDLENFNHYLQPIVIALLVSSIFYIVCYYKHRQETRVKEQKIIAGSASAKFDALKNQLDPHFLFNSLNVLTSLIEEDPAQAQKFTTSLSKVYRYVLEQKSKTLISVDEELQFARTYVRLLKMRFEDSIVFEIPEKASDPELKIVPLSLQLLLENAVKHNVVNASRPLHISIYEEGGYLYVANNLQEKSVVKKSSGVGLQNIRQRYAMLTKKEMQIFKTSSDFKVRLPMLRAIVEYRETQESYINNKRYEKARERVEAIKGFYGNLTAYCIVIPILAYINYRTTSFIWVIFPALGWGLGLLGHGLKAYGYNPLFGKNWEERKIRQYMEDENF